MFQALYPMYDHTTPALDEEFDDILFELDPDYVSTLTGVQHHAIEEALSRSLTEPETYR